MKKVLILASVASMIDQFNMENINILKELGYEVHVAANFENGSTSSKERMIKFKKELDEINVTYFHIDFSRNITNIFENIKAYKQVKRVIKDNNYEFIHCHSPIGGVCGRIAAKVTNTKAVYTAHGFHFFKGSSRKNWILFYPIEKYLSYITDVLITINKEDYELAKSKMKAKNIYYIPGIGVDTNKFKSLSFDRNKKRKEINIGENDIMILSVGELNKNKNHEVIIKALAKIKKDNIHYCIAGRGKLDIYLKELSQTLGIENNVHLLGFRTDINELYNISDIFCFPSYREGLSVALMEAMSSDLPVVCSNIRGNVDLIQDKKGGYLCDVRSINQFSKSIEKLINDIDSRNLMGEYNKNYIKKFDVDVVKNEMTLIYDSLRS